MSHAAPESCFVGRRRAPDGLFGWEVRLVSVAFALLLMGLAPWIDNGHFSTPWIVHLRRTTDHLGSRFLKAIGVVDVFANRHELLAPRTMLAFRRAIGGRRSTTRTQS